MVNAPAPSTDRPTAGLASPSLNRCPVSCSPEGADTNDKDGAAAPPLSFVVIASPPDCPGGTGDYPRLTAAPEAGLSILNVLRPFFPSHVVRMDAADVVVWADVVSPAPPSVPWNEPVGVPLGTLPGIEKVALPSDPMLPATELTLIALGPEDNLGVVVHLVVRVPTSSLLPANVVRNRSHRAVRVEVRTPEALALVTVTPSLVVQPVSLALIVVLEVPALSSDVIGGLNLAEPEMPVQVDRSVSGVHLGRTGARSRPNCRSHTQRHSGRGGDEK